MDEGHYINLPADNGKNSPEKREDSHSGWSKVFWVVGVSFGLLCITQSALNISLRLQGFGFCNKSDLIYSANGDVNALLLKRDQLEKENRELQDSNNQLTGDIELFNNQLNQQQNYIMQLQTEKERLMMRLSETEQISRRCPVGWSLSISSCYQLSTERDDWSYAREDCMEKGAHLMIFNDERKEDVLHTFGSSPVWIGLRTRQNGRSKTWTWVNGSQLTDVDRIQPLPDDRRVYCAYSKRSPLGGVIWVGASCGEQHYWVCEKELK